MKKIDHTKEFGILYKQPKNKISLVTVPPLQYLMIDGVRDPNNNPDYSEAVAALYAIAYKLKFQIKNSPFEIDYKVMPLEGLWWAQDMSQFTLENRANWHWTMMILQPDLITRDLFTETVEMVMAKKENPKIVLTSSEMS